MHDTSQLAFQTLISIISEHPESDSKQPNSGSNHSNSDSSWPNSGSGHLSVYVPTSPTLLHTSCSSSSNRWSPALL